MQIFGEFTLSFYVIVIFIIFFYSYVYSNWNDQIFISIVWRATGQSPSQYVQPAGWWESSHHSLNSHHAAGSFDRGYCSVRNKYPGSSSLQNLLFYVYTFDKTHYAAVGRTFAVRR